MSTDSRTQLAKPLPAETSISAFFADQVNANGVATNIRETGRAGLAMAMKATSQPTVPVEGARDIPFPMKWYYCHLVPLVNNATGEVDDRIRVVLISPEGETLACMSAGVIDSLDMIRRFEGDGPYDPPIPVRFTLQKTRSNRTVQRMEVVFDEPKPAGPADNPRNRK